MIELRNLVKTYGYRVVLKGINLTINEGEFVTLMGANGAGKSTLMHIVATLVLPTGGEVLLNGYNLRDAATQLRRFIGLVSHKTLLYEELTAAQNLHFYGQMYDVSDLAARIEAVLSQVGLWERRDDLVRTYSRGMQQRLAIARAILHNPPILLLDEPDTGLDQHAAALLTQLLKAVGTDQRTILMTTHHLERGLSLGDRVVILARGKIAEDVRDINAETLRARYSQYVGGPH